MNISIVWIHSDCVSFIEINSWLHVPQENRTHLDALILMLKNRNRTKATLLHVIEFFNEYSMLLKWVSFSYFSVSKFHVVQTHSIARTNCNWTDYSKAIIDCTMSDVEMSRKKCRYIGTQSAVKRTVPWNPILLLSLVKWVFEIFGTAPLSSPIPYYTQRRPFCSVNA